MPRNKSIVTEEFIHLVDEYRFENPGMVVKIPRFGEYIRSKGYDVKDYTIRRDKEFAKYINALNQQSAETQQTDLVTYKTLDADAFIEHNRGKECLRTALIERDRYYARIAANAVDAIQKKKAMEVKIRELTDKVTEVESKIKDISTKLDNEKQKQKDEIILKLKKILDSYIYPDAANAILEKEGILEAVGSIVPRKVMDEMTMHADTYIGVSDSENENSDSDTKRSKYKSVNCLRFGFGSTGQKDKSC